jgi:eukaryotic-like serine/threonine-protein kinase
MTTPIAGKYELAEEIGRGGMGVVFRAHDVQLQRRVALKFLPPELGAAPEYRARFMVEARAAAALSHPNICVIHEVGEADARPFIAMEYVEGETLRNRVAAGPLGCDEAVALMVQVLAGLAEAHRHGITHRDIKSGNIMITPAGQAKIMDFGLARREGSPALTRTHATLGTAEYMSPEQARGEVVDHRTDLWSAGVVLYELLTGDVPFRGAQELAVVHAVVHSEPPPLSRRAPAVPPELQAVVSRALRKKREARYASATEMLRDLTRFQEERRAQAAGALTPRALVRRARRPAVAVPAVVALLALTSFGVWDNQRRANVRWALEVALPELQRILDEEDLRNTVPAYRLGEQAERYLPRDSTLAAMMELISRRIGVRTEPAGARVFMQPYDEPEGEWRVLGLTPLEQVRVPMGLFRWRLEKEGYEPVLAVSPTVFPEPGTQHVTSPLDLERTLDPVGTIPPGMVRVRGADQARGRIEDFFIDRYEVTNREFQRFVDADGYRKRGYWKHPFVEDGRELGWEEAMTRFVDRTGRPGPATWSGGEHPPGKEDHPLSGLSWYEAAAYAEFAGKSLPTRTHWSIAAGRTVPLLGWYTAALVAAANFAGAETMPVGASRSMTAYGALDMGGNVREWCWNESPAGRLVSGGSWEDAAYQFGRWAQLPPMDRSPGNGLRLALYPEIAPTMAWAFEPARAPFSPAPYTFRPMDDAVFQVYRERHGYDPAPLNARVEYRKQSAAGWVEERISFDAAYAGERVAAHLFLPANAQPPYQTVIYFPGSYVVFGPSSSDLENYWEFTNYLSFLVKNGRAVLFPIYQGTFERAEPSLTELHWGGIDSRAHFEFQTHMVKDFSRSIDYLETRADIDTGKLAFYGLSWGGCMGALIPALEGRLAASVLLGGYLSNLALSGLHDGHAAVRVRTPTLMLNGRYDPVGLEARIRPLFDLLGTPAEHKRLILFDGDHLPPRGGINRETLAWLDRYLGPVAR